MSVTTWQSLSSATRDLLFAYCLVVVPMLGILLLRRAAFRHLLLAPVLAVFVTVLAAILWSGIRPALASTAAPLGAAGLQTLGAAFFMALGVGAGFLTLRPQRRDAYKRGAIIEDRLSARRVSKSALTLAGVAIPELDETKHFKFIGTTGTDKSTAIRELLSGALARGDRVVLADPDAGYVDRFYSPAAGDLILNPFDARSRTWDLFAEIRQPYDVEQLSRSLIPDHEGSDRTWRSYGRTFLTAVARQLWEVGNSEPSVRNVAELYRLISIAPADELRLLVAGTPAQPFLESGNERMFGSVRSVTSAALAALEHVAQQDAPTLSIRQWIREGQGRSRVLYLPYQAGQISALRSMISAWMRLAIFETMNGGERDQRIWFIVDELDALGQIDGLKDALARLRKFGGRCVLGFQSIAQVSGTYGNAEAQTIVENCGNTLILRCSASEGGGTARFASRLIGDREVVRPQVTRGRTGGWFDQPRHSVSRGEQHVTEAAVLPAEIEQLPDLHGYLKVASRPEWRRVEFALPQ